MIGQKNASSNTIASYALTFKLFFEYCEKVKGISIATLSLAAIDGSVIIGFLEWLEKERNCSVTTRNQRLVAIHSFFRYVQKQKPVYMETCADILTIPYKKTTKTIVEYLTELEMQDLLKQPNGKQWNEFRDKVLLSVLYDTGARVQELVDLKIKDVRLDRPSIVTLQGKGHKIRQVPIMQSTVKLLENYLNHYNGNRGIARGDNPLFMNQKMEPLSREGTEKVPSR